jgi:hypothetical protein
VVKRKRKRLNSRDWRAAMSVNKQEVMMVNPCQIIVYEKRSKRNQQTSIQRRLLAVVGVILKFSTLAFLLR